MNINLELRLLILLVAILAFAVLGGLGFVVGADDKQLIVTALAGSILAAGGTMLLPKPKDADPPAELPPVAGGLDTPVATDGRAGE